MYNVLRAITNFTHLSEKYSSDIITSIKNKNVIYFIFFSQINSVAFFNDSLENLFEFKTKKDD